MTNPKEKHDKIRQQCFGGETPASSPQAPLEPFSGNDARFRALLAASPFAIQIHDAAGTLIEVNQAWRELWGIDPGEMLGRYNILNDPGARGTGLAETARRTLAGEIWSLPDFEWDMTAAGSRRAKRWMRCRGYPLQAEDGSGALALITFEDRTAYRQYEERYNIIVDNAHEAIMIIQDDRLKYFNQKATEIAGYSGEEYLDRPFTQFVHPEHQEMVLRRHRLRVAGEAVPHFYQVKVVHKDGGTRWLHVNAIRFEWEGRPASLAFLNDISTQKEAEEALERYRNDLEEHIAQRTQELEKANAELLKSQKLESLGVLAGGIAHDFNNLLGAIIGNVSLALLLNRQDETLSGLLREIEKASLRARDITGQLLTFAKGGAPVRKAAYIGDLIRDSCTFVLHGTNIRFDCEIADDLWAVDIDTGQFSQVLQNLVLNAKDAMPDGGVVAVSCRNVKVGSRTSLRLPPGKYVRIAVADQGHGIAPESLPNIFDPYFTTKKTGSGLGLAVAYSVVRKHEGTITVETHQEEGTTFVIHLPATGKSMPCRVDQKETVTAGKGRVLVMDDEEMLLKAAAMMLELVGYEACTARDGKEALALYGRAREENRPFAAVILDLTIPGGMGGEETIRRLREIDPEVRAIVSSGYTNNPIMANYREHGFVGVIPKPYRIEDLSKMLHDTIMGGKA